MLILKTTENLERTVSQIRQDGRQVHFVPTMGALHQGHISLVENARKQGCVVVVSVFVNPTQFNEAKDLDNYPRTFEKDRILLEQNNCDIMFCPTQDQIYPHNKQEDYDLSGLDANMEGKFRPGHFQGVVQVVDRLLSIVKPDTAYFGEKDFQQLAIISSMMPKLGHRTRIVGCPTIRNESGLALSSRNLLLSEEARTEACLIHTALKQLRENYQRGQDLTSIIDVAKKIIQNSEGFELEYLEVVDPKSLKSIEANKKLPAVACVAAAIEGIRLIDNMRLFP